MKMCVCTCVSVCPWMRSSRLLATCVTMRFFVCVRVFEAHQRPPTQLTNLIHFTLRMSQISLQITSETTHGQMTSSEFSCSVDRSIWACTRIPDRLPASDAPLTGLVGTHSCLGQLLRVCVQRSEKPSKIINVPTEPASISLNISTMPSCLIMVLPHHWHTTRPYRFMEHSPTQSQSDRQRTVLNLERTHEMSTLLLSFSECTNELAAKRPLPCDNPSLSCYAHSISESHVAAVSGESRQKTVRRAQ
jgi:hypothetical protein